MSKVIIRILFGRTLGQDAIDLRMGRHGAFWFRDDTFGTIRPNGARIICNERHGNVVVTTALFLPQTVFIPTFRMHANDISTLVS
mmetsp:Transcript_98/g.264  ORF Transcript_98/g.264 Transcript_98/m.264 type:complete len:85 (-) Transcript_98:82-336(-)